MMTTSSASSPSSFPIPSSFLTLSEGDRDYSVCAQTGTLTATAPGPEEDIFLKVWNLVLVGNQDSLLEYLDSHEVAWGARTFNPAIPLHFYLRSGGKCEVLEGLLTILTIYNLRTYEMCHTAALLGDQHLFVALFKTVSLSLSARDRRNIQTALFRHLCSPGETPLEKELHPQETRERLIALEFIYEMLGMDD